MNVHSPVTRSPNGCSCQVMTQITPEERDQLKEVAASESRSLSATVRLMALRGLEQYQQSRSEAVS